MQVTNALRKEYRIRVNVQGRKSLIVGMPYEVIEREARNREISVEEFLKRFQAVAQYDSFAGVHYIFEEINDSKNKEAKE